jgi:hypothetical protein
MLSQASVKVLSQHRLQMPDIHPEQLFHLGQGTSVRIEKNSRASLRK